jgi:hypothetical protein
MIPKGTPGRCAGGVMLKDNGPCPECGAGPDRECPRSRLAEAEQLKRLRATLEESELSHIICGVLNCTDCPGDEHGADPAQSKCRKVALTIRAAGFSSSASQETKP